MHHQSTNGLAALLLLLSPATFAAVIQPTKPVDPTLRSVCQRSSLIAIAAMRAPDCKQAECASDGKLVLQGAPAQCEKLCKCPMPPKPSMDGTPPNSMPGMGPASIVRGNSLGVTYVATLPDSKTSGVRGTVTGSSSLDGTGVDFKIDLSGFPDAALGPFSYHIHDQPVPADGNCTMTKAHLDPFKRGPMPPCDPKHPETCEVGDLAGKHGKITTNPFQASYHDQFLSTAEGPGSFFGNRSVVIHQKDTTRLTCANFTLSPPAIEDPNI